MKRLWSNELRQPVSLRHNLYRAVKRLKLCHAAVMEAVFWAFICFTAACAIV